VGDLLRINDRSPIPEHRGELVTLVKIYSDWLGDAAMNVDVIRSSSGHLELWSLLYLDELNDNVE